jgi:uroporphyrinogen-III synthase
MIPLVVIRPQPGADATVMAATALGLDPHAFPLFAVAPVMWEAPDPARIDALLIGSANALRHGGGALERYRGKPVYAVGQTTAAECRAAGLTVAVTGSGGLEGVVASIAGPARLLRLAGREHIALAPPAGVELVKRIVYASEPLPMTEELADLLHTSATVLLHSAAAATHFAAECDRLGLRRGKIALVSIGPRVTAACGTGWAEVATAASPDDASLLAQARHMCQNRDRTLHDGAD